MRVEPPVSRSWGGAERYTNPVPRPENRLLSMRDPARGHVPLPVARVHTRTHPHARYIPPNRISKSLLSRRCLSSALAWRWRGVNRGCPLAVTRTGQELVNSASDSPAQDRPTDRIDRPTA